MAEWKTVGELFDFEKGSLQSSKCIPGEYPFITAAEEWKTHESYTHDCEALVFAMAASGSLGRTHYVNGRFISSDLCFVLTPKKNLRIDLVFYHRLFSLLRPDIVQKTATGTSKLSINSSHFRTFRLPYFDYEYQVNSRAKVEAIAKIMDEFSAQLDQQSVLLNKLRQQILQEAIEGELTAEWRRDNPALVSGDNHASRLIEGIRAEKERLIKEGKIKKEKPLPPITDSEMPLALPNGWSWCHINDTGESVNNAIVDGPFGSNLLTSDYDKYGEYPVLTITCLGQGFNVAALRRINKSKYEQLKRSTTKGGDVLVAKIGSSYGKVGEYPEGYPDAIIPANLLKITLNSRVNKLFFKYLLRSPFFKGQLRGVTQFHAQPAFNLRNFKRIPIPIPPMAEQRAIVDKLEDFMNMIDKLEVQISMHRKQSEMLMQAALREAFMTS